MANDMDKRTEDASFAYTKEWEGFSADAKADQVGIPTYGHGYALLLRSGNNFQMKPRSDIEADLSTIGVQLTDAQYRQLESMAKVLKIANTLLDRGRKSEANARLAEAERLRVNAKFPNITKAQAEQLFRNVVQESIKTVRDHIGKDVYDKLDPERRAALIDQAYRRPTAFKRAAKGIGAALAKDDFEGAKQAFLKMGKGARSRTNAEYLRNPHAADRVRVRDGDTLGAIAQRVSAERGTKVTAKELEDLNGLPSADKIFKGQLLRLPETVGSDVGAPGSFPASPDPKGTTKPDRRGELAPAPTKESPERVELRAAMRQPVERADHTLLKPTLDLTRAEIDDVMGHDEYWPRDGHDRAEAFQNKTRDYFETFHERGTKVTPPETERPLTAFGGGDLGAARERVADALAPAAERDGHEPTVEVLQEALNDQRFAGAGRVLPDLVVDGDLGPRTLARVDEELVRDGDGPFVAALRRRFA